MLVASQVLIWVCALAVVVSLAEVPPTARHLGLFAKTYELEVTPTNRCLLSSYIMWIRAWRLGGAVVVFVGLEVWQRVGETTFDWGVAPLAVGYALGATVGEWLRPRPPTTWPRKASLRPRTVTEYVRPWVLAAIGVCSVLAVACTAIYAVHHAIRSASLVSLSGLALMGSAMVAYFVAVRVSWYGDDLPWPLRRIGGYGAVVSSLGALVGFGLSFRAIPRFAPFWHRLPPVPEAAA